jgi:probable addiction module antidote protein
MRLPVLTSNRVWISPVHHPNSSNPAATIKGKPKMPKRKRICDPGLYKRRLDPAYAMEYITAALADDAGADAIHYLSLLEVARANHMTYIAESTGIKREDLFKKVSRRGSRGINSLKAALNAIGLRLPVGFRGTAARRTVAACIRSFSNSASAASSYPKPRAPGVGRPIS